MRSTRNQPFCWQEKKITRLLRKNFKGTARVKILVLYATITEIDSDFNNKDIKYYTKTISTYSGLDRDYIPKALKILEDLNIIEISENRESGKFGGKLLKFTPEKIEEMPPKTVAGKTVNGKTGTGERHTLEDSILLEDSIYKEDNKKASQGSATYPLKEKTLKEFRNQRRVESGRLPMTPRKMTDKQVNINTAFKAIEYFKQKGYSEHGMMFLEVKNEKRNSIVRKLIIEANKNVENLNDLIDWWFDGAGEFWSYEPEQCFSVKSIERFKNNKVKGGGKRYE